MLQQYVILNAVLILVPALIVFASLLFQRILHTDSTTEFSGSSGEINLAVLAVYIAIPNLMLFLWTQYNRSH